MLHAFQWDVGELVLMTVVIKFPEQLQTKSTEFTSGKSNKSSMSNQSLLKHVPNTDFGCVYWPNFCLESGFSNVFQANFEGDKRKAFFKGL